MNYHSTTVYVNALRYRGNGYRIYWQNYTPPVRPRGMMLTHGST